jgi:hypothetical protein
LLAVRQRSKQASTASTSTTATMDISDPKFVQVSGGQATGVRQRGRGTSACADSWGSSCCCCISLSKAAPAAASAGKVESAEEKVSEIRARPGWGQSTRHSSGARAVAGRAAPLVARRRQSESEQRDAGLRCAAAATAVLRGC